MAMWGALEANKINCDILIITLLLNFLTFSFSTAPTAQHLNTINGFIKQEGPVYFKWVCIKTMQFVTVKHLNNCAVYLLALMQFIHLRLIENFIFLTSGPGLLFCSTLNWKLIRHLWWSYMMNQHPSNIPNETD